MKCEECGKKVKGQGKEIVSEYGFVHKYCQECFEQFEFVTIGVGGQFKKVGV